MRTVTLVLLFVTFFLIFGGLLTLAIIFDDIYIQLVFDFGLIVISGLLGYYTKASVSKKASIHGRIAKRRRIRQAVRAPRVRPLREKVVGREIFHQTTLN